MRKCFTPLFNGLLRASLLSVASIGSAVAAVGNCAALGPLPAALEVGEGLQQALQSPVAITRVAVGDPKIADVRVTGDQSVLLTGVAPGATTLMIWTACTSAPRQSMVFVQGKASAAMTVSLPATDDPTLPSQVQTDIRFVEVSRTKLKEAGTQIFGKGSNNFLFGAPGTVPGTGVTPGVVPLRNIDPRIAVPSIPLVNDAFNIVWGGGSSKFLGIVNALEGSGFAYTLARPSLVALSGQSASFLAGGEIPIPVPSANSNSYSIEYKEFGIRLTLTPTVVGRDRIAL